MTNRTNILFITTDQHRGDCLGIEGSVHPVMTPHLDQLAFEGVRFGRAYSDCPMCVPARMTIMTGRCAYRHGVANMGAEALTKPIPEKSNQTLPGRLTAAGYQTHAAGKMHFYPPRGRKGFESMRLHPEDYVNWLEGTPYPGGHRGHGLGGNEVYPTFSSVPLEYYHTRWVVNESIDFLRQRDPDCPFFMWTSFEAPHPPYDPPEQFVRLYDGMDIPQPISSSWSSSKDIPFWIQNERWVRKMDLLPEKVVEAARKHYYAQITHIDYELGRLFGELKSQGLWENTVILFTSDHGDMLGDQRLFHKTCLYEPSARVPFIIRVPKQYESIGLPGSYRSGAVQLADIYPTLLDLAGIWSEEEQSERDGCSLMRNHDDPVDQRWIFGFVDVADGLYMATNGQWKYLYYVCGGREQLFDLASDPDETIDLIHNHSPKDILSACRKRLAEKFPELASGTNSELRRTDPPLTDETSTRSKNPFAWRGPMRYGGGY